MPNHAGRRTDGLTRVPNAAYANPRVFIFAGGMCRAGELIQGPVRVSYGSNRGLIDVFEISSLLLGLASGRCPNEVCCSGASRSSE